MDIEIESGRTLFVWDMEKAAENLTKHGIEFTEATSVFTDPLCMASHGRRSTSL
jgi:uncharacterized DUF497 family protein